MKHCPDCRQNKPENQFFPKSKHCKACNQALYDDNDVGGLIRRFYQPEYPAHIQEYLDKRNERLSLEEAREKLARAEGIPTLTDLVDAFKDYDGPEICGK